MITITVVLQVLSYYATCIWLPTATRIEFKLTVLVFWCLNEHELPPYRWVADQESRQRLQSALTASLTRLLDECSLKLSASAVFLFSLWHLVGMVCLPSHLISTLFIGHSQYFLIIAYFSVMLKPNVRRYYTCCLSYVPF